MNKNIFIWTDLSMQNRTAKHSTVCHYETLCVSVSNSHSLGGFRFGNCVDIRFLLQHGCQLTSSLSLQPTQNSLRSLLRLHPCSSTIGWAFLEERQNWESVMCVGMRVHLNLIIHLLITLKQMHRKNKAFQDGTYEIKPAVWNFCLLFWQWE